MPHTPSTLTQSFAVPTLALLLSLSGCGENTETYDATGSHSASGGAQKASFNIWWGWEEDEGVISGLNLNVEIDGFADDSQWWMGVAQFGEDGSLATTRTCLHRDDDAIDNSCYESYVSGQDAVEHVIDIVDLETEGMVPPSQLDLSNTTYLFYESKTGACFIVGGNEFYGQYPDSIQGCQNLGASVGG